MRYTISDTLIARTIGSQPLVLDSRHSSGIVGIYHEWWNHIFSGSVLLWRCLMNKFATTLFKFEVSVYDDTKKCDLDAKSWKHSRKTREIHGFGGARKMSQWAKRNAHYSVLKCWSMRYNWQELSTHSTWPVIMMAKISIVWCFTRKLTLWRTVLEAGCK